MHQREPVTCRVDRRARHHDHGPGTHAPATGLDHRQGEAQRQMLQGQTYFGQQDQRKSRNCVRRGMGVVNGTLARRSTHRSGMAAKPGYVVPRTAAGKAPPLAKAEDGIAKEQPTARYCTYPPTIYPYSSLKIRKLSSAQRIVASAAIDWPTIIRRGNPERVVPHATSLESSNDSADLVTTIQMATSNE